MSASPLRSLDEWMEEDEYPRLNVTNGILAFPYFWQEPAATEKAAFQAVMKARQLDKDSIYIGYPWATLIDALRRSSSHLPALLAGLEQLAEALKAQDLPARRVSVAQHIHARQFIRLFKVLGITDLFWSHTTKSEQQAEGVALHPFPLFPAQAPIVVTGEKRLTPRRYLANFIGAYNPKIYLSNVRQIIFNDSDKEDDLLILKREAWHFNRVVYVEQMAGVSASEEQARMEREAAKEYLDAIRQSWFTLCPTGSGPNSIRIYEALALGSIPIILTESLHLVGPQTLWNKACLLEEDSEAGYRRAIARARAMSHEKRQKTIIAGAELFSYVAPENYANLITETYRNLEGV